MYDFVVYIYRYIYIRVIFCDPPKDVAICVYMCVECVYLCVIVAICVVFCVNMCNMCHFVSYCVVLCVFLCVLCVFVRISASRIVGCVFPPPKLMYRTASRMSYLLRCQFWGVQSWGCVYMCVFGV